MDSYRLDYGDPGPPGVEPKNPMYHFKGSSSHPQDSKPRPPRDFTFRAPRPKIAERPLLSLRRGPSPDLISSKPEGNGTAKFRDIDDMTDTDAEDMDVSDSDDESATAERIKLDTQSEDKSAAKWSNPDPYTALPPVDETARKRTDVVKLIRKSRVATSSGDNTDTGASNEDFISFDFGGMGDFDTGSQAPKDAPTGPRSRGQGDTSLGKRKRTVDDEGRPGALKNIRGVHFHDNAAILDEWRSNENPTPWYKDSKVQTLQHPLMRLHTEIIDFYDWVRPKDYEHAVRSDVIARLAKVLRRMEPGSELHAFGSFAAGLYLPTGDMDLVLYSADFVRAKRSGRPYFPAKRKHTWYFNFARTLERLGIPAGPPLAIPRAKVPLIKFVDKVSGIKVDLSFDNDTGVVANETFQRWKIQLPEMPIIVSIIKQFLMIRGLNDNAAGGLGGFSTICLVTSLIQMLPRDPGTPNLGRLLVEFFNLYGNVFNKEEVGIRMEPPGYFEKRSYKPFVYQQNKRERLSIIDPNRPDNDISGGSQHIAIIFKAFAGAYVKLKEKLTAAAMHGDIDESILGDIIGGNYKYYDTQRVHLKAVYDATHPDPVPSSVVPPPPSLPPPPEAKPPPPSLTTVPEHAQPGSTKSHNLAFSQATSTEADASQQSQPSNAITHSSVSASHPPLQPSSFTPINGTRKEKISKRSKMRDRADKLKRLRPDLEVPSQLSEPSAVALGGYSDLQEMKKDLMEREALLAAGKPLPPPALPSSARVVPPPVTAIPSLDGARSPVQSNNSTVEVGTGNAARKQLLIQGSNANKRRADRLRKLRPDIQGIPQSLSLEEAVTIGGYQTPLQMDEDLARRHVAVESSKPSKMASATNYPELLPLRATLPEAPAATLSNKPDQKKLAKKNELARPVKNAMNGVKKNERKKKKGGPGTRSKTAAAKAAKQ